MIINALNSGAKVFMADFEDVLSPSWENLMRGQVNLKDAVNRTISFHDKARNRVYKLNDQTAKLFVRLRGWHLPATESHIFIDGEPATGCLVDFTTSVSIFSTTAWRFPRHKVKASGLSSISRKWKTGGKQKFGTMYSRGLKNWLELRGEALEPVLIETLPAVFQMDEILYDLRDHSVGLNCGRCDYIFS